MALELQLVILGAGMTGLAAGVASGATIYEAAPIPGGICASYYLRPGDATVLHDAPTDGEAYRFELGGGHWIFGADAMMRQFINRYTKLTKHDRLSSVYFRDKQAYVPYPLQNHLRCLGSDIAAQALREIAQPHNGFRTMRDWLLANFGVTLCDRFFFPFHDRYTAGLYPRIAPQDAQKSPISLPDVIRGAFADVAPVGYNVSFFYPTSDLSALARQLAAQCSIRYEKRAVAIDAQAKIITFADGTQASYATLISTLPLNVMLDLTGISLDIPPDPCTSVLVLNIGAVKGAKCPNDHWLYNPDTRSGFHRVGFYSHVDASFLPTSARAAQNRVAMYIERAYPQGQRPTEGETADYIADVIRELQEWEFIGDVEVAHPTWVDVAYTWAWPDSEWKARALQALEQRDIYQAGRYGRWAFQGIAESLREGLLIGAALK